jgi:CTP synthase
MNILELRPDLHPFYMGTQAHPELTSRPLAPHPMFIGLVHAALQRAHADYAEPLVFPRELPEPLVPAPTSEPCKKRLETV